LLIPDGKQADGAEDATLGVFHLKNAPPREDAGDKRVHPAVMYIKLT